MRILRLQLIRCFASISFLMFLYSGFILGQHHYLHCGRLIDGTGSEPLEEMTLIIHEDSITDVREGYVAPSEGVSVINLKNHTVMPGLIDLHVHIESQTSPTQYLDRVRLNPPDVAYGAIPFAKTTLMAGFTTVRDCGGSGVNIALRKAIKKGLVPGPRIFTSGKAIGTTGGHADPTNGLRDDLAGDPGPKDGVVNGSSDAAKAVRQRYKNGADFIKITATGGVLSVAKDGKRPQFTSEEIEAIVNTATDYDMHTAAHAHGPEGMLRAVKAGITTIEHGTIMTEEVMAAMKEMGTWYVPTITAGQAVAEYAKIEGYFPAVIVPKALEIGPMIQQTFENAYKYGVKIAFGTDAAVFPHGENWKEFVYMVEGGMPALETIKCATLNAATVLGMEDQFGTLKSGMKADIIAVPGNPLEDMALMEEVSFVMKEGMIYKHQ